MAMVKDPVCGMMIETSEAMGPTRFRDKTFYFCSKTCLEQFEQSPRRYADEFVRPTSVESDTAADAPEPPFTKKDGMTAPKFGSAGSGGLEYEPRPPRDKDRKER